MAGAGRNYGLEVRLEIGQGLVLVIVYQSLISVYSFSLNV
jgi:hypothetical protein